MRIVRCLWDQFSPSMSSSRMHASLHMDLRILRKHCEYGSGKYGSARRPRTSSLVCAGYDTQNTEVL